MPATLLASRLAINGGARAIKEGFPFHVWPRTDKLDEQYVLESLRGNAHAWGPNCTKLQEEFAVWNGNKFAAATNSGTAALHMSIAACGIGVGDEVITTALSWTSSATCILHHNAIPVFVDVEWKTMLMDPTKIEAAITPKTKAILVVHYWGVPCDMDRIMAIAQKHNLFVIEDACQAHGALYKGRKVGTFGHCNAFSLNQNKNFCGGEGGIMVTDDEDLYVKGRALMNFGEMRAPESKRDFHSYGMGWMYRTSDLPAAFARAQLAKLTKTNRQARDNWFGLYDALDGLPHLELPFQSEKQGTNGYAFVIRADRNWVRKQGLTLKAVQDGLHKALCAEGVPVGPARWLLPAHTVFQAKNGYGKGCPWECPHARPGISYDLSQYPEGVDCVDSCLWLSPNGVRPPNGMKQIKAVAKAIRKVFENVDEVPFTR